MKKDKDNCKRRKQGAEDRVAQRAARTDEQQLGRLDALGHRALQERARLTKRIEASSKQEQKQKGK